MFHVPAHKNVTHPAAQLSLSYAHFAAPALVHGWLNLYVSGFYHSAGKPGAFDRHAGDVYATREAAVAEIEPMDYYVATVPVTWREPRQIDANPYV